VAGFSLRGNSLPDAGKVDPRININDQPWRQPVVLDGDTASLRWRQRLSADWQFSAHGMTQRLVSDDRMAFPFGCYDAAADIYYADRYCP
jgi:iron complex outermembrane receptor protein